jgi:hypothetical protein
MGGGRVTRRSCQGGRAGRWQLGRRHFLVEFRCVTKRIAQIFKPFDPAQPGGGQRRKVQGGRVSRGRLQVWFMATTTPLRIIPVRPSLRFASLPQHQEDEEERRGKKIQRDRRDTMEKGL